MRNEVLEAILAEIALQKHYLQGENVETVYFGGGTPSILSIDELQRIFDKIYNTFQIDKLKECTLEANPDDLTLPYLKALKTTPVSRFSIGVQSFKDSCLQYMNRAHDAQQADFAIKAAQDTGFTNLSIDLIYGTPGLSNNDWRHNLEKVRQLNIPHLSSYALTVEENTALHHAITKKKTVPVDAGQSAAQFNLLSEWGADNGYDQYEISNLAKPGMYAVHNTNYWMGKPYLGIGPSAHSYNCKARQWNVANNALYTQSILKKNEVPFEQEILTDEQQVNEYIMTSLRTMWGCDLNKIAHTWGATTVDDIMDSSKPYINSGRLKLEGNTLTVTPAGKLFADGIAGDLFI